MRKTRTFIWGQANGLCGQMSCFKQWPLSDDPESVYPTLRKMM